MGSLGAKDSGNGKGENVFELTVNNKPDESLARAESFNVKASASTWTLKDENGKTRGMIRGITQFRNLQTREQFDISNKLKNLGVDRTDVMRHDIAGEFYSYDKQPVYAMNQDYFDHHAKYGFINEEERQRFNERKAFINSLNDKGVKIVKIRKG